MSARENDRRAASPPAHHLVSAAAAWQQILSEMHPDQDWVVTVQGVVEGGTKGPTREMQA